MPFTVVTHTGSVELQTSAGHMLKYAGKGEQRQIVCMRCTGRGPAANADQVLAFAEAHGGAKCP